MRTLSAIVIAVSFSSSVWHAHVMLSKQKEKCKTCLQHYRSLQGCTLLRCSTFIIPSLKSVIVMEFDGRFSKSVPTDLLLTASFLKISGRHLPSLMASMVTAFH